MTTRALGYGLGSVLFLFCACHGQEHTTSIPPSQARFPWPSQLARSQEPLCQKASSRIEGGLAFESDVWLVASCVVSELDRAERDGDVEPFLRSVREFRKSGDFYWVPALQLPAELKTVQPNLPGESEVAIYATAQMRSRHHEIATVSKKALGAGGYRGLCLPWRSVGGHYQVTSDVVKELAKTITMSPAVGPLMADASQDPDIFRWNAMEAHGQTADKDGVPSQTEADAQTAWRKFVTDWLTQAKRSCEQPGDDSARRGAYALAFALHAVEDVAPHRGRTNPEHAYQAFYGQSPDEETTIDHLAFEMAVAVARAALDGPLAVCKPRFATLPPGLLSFPEKKKAFTLTMDGTPAAYAVYEASALKFDAHKSESTARVRWFGPNGRWPEGGKCSDDVKCKSLLDRLIQDVQAIQ